MENIQTAIQAAIDTMPTDFKDAIYGELSRKVDDALLLKKIEISNSIFNNKTEDDAGVEDGQDFKTEEENVDEDL
jgi:hypothetical protein